MSNKADNIIEMNAQDNAGEAGAMPAQNAETGDTSVYTHVFKKPFEREGRTYTELTFDFGKLTGRDMLAIESEMQAMSEYALAPEISASFQCKMAARAAGIGSDLLEALPLKDFNKITGATRRFLLDSGY